jgi:hypothetical protein
VNAAAATNLGSLAFLIFDRPRRENVVRAACAILEFKNNAGVIMIA